MVSSPQRRVAWILLLAALAQPGWSVLDALVHEHIASEHQETHAHTLPLAPRHLDEDRQPAHEHSHFDEALPLASRISDVARCAALPSASFQPVAISRPVRAVRESAAARTQPESVRLLHPRAPPRA